MDDMAGQEKTSGTLRGHKIERIDGVWFFVDTGEPAAGTWQGRPCGYCGLQNTADDHDGCLGVLKGGVINARCHDGRLSVLKGSVINACCGHGDIGQAYVQFETGLILRREEAVAFFKAQGKGHTFQHPPHS